MADKRLALVYNLTSPAQVFELYPPEGVPAAAATYTVWRGYRGDDETAEFTGTATADSFSQALSAASGYSQTNRRRINLSTTTGLVVGRLYLLSNALGQSEVVKIAAISSASYADAEYDLAYDYPITTSTLAGFRQSFSPPASFVQTESLINAEEYPYRLRWDYTVGGVARRFFQYFDLLRHDPDAGGIVDDDLKDAWPDIAYLVSEDRRRRIMNEARAQLDTDLRVRKVDPALVRQGAVRSQLLKAAWKMLAAQTGAAIPQGYDGPTALRTFTRGYLDALEMAVQAALPQTQNRGDDNVDPRPERGLLLIS